jgi:hypothetical protein
MTRQATASAAGAGGAGVGPAGTAMAQAGRSGDATGEMCGGSHVSGLGTGRLLDRASLPGPIFFRST